MRFAHLKGAAAALSLAAVFASPAHAVVEKPLIPFVAASKTGSAWPAGAVIGVAGVLVTYDFIRRLTCVGDVFGLGGPGFGQPIGPNTSAIPPRVCPPRP